MLEALNSWLEHWEPIWLFSLIALEALIGLTSFYILWKEFVYDKDFNEQYIVPKKRFKQKKVAFTLPEEKLTTGEMQ